MGKNASADNPKKKIGPPKISSTQTSNLKIESHVVGCGFTLFHVIKRIETHVRRS